ncbi:hypothetical protein LOTGIDRAFT_158590 [Lottia gigantea]|uniref:Protein sleepless n=1 Tax=Lottia gigantea TaxID=225164 RepID=V4A6F8_LOTGI|nr:hypothetical protein LOTGIDRAFT_158590 [Lottia gigantea]ESO99498.1 hypothetical protein LOTGIDRAFT_158590 [Lottia gigantea]
MGVSMHVVITLITLQIFLTDKVQSDAGNIRCFYCHDTGKNRNCWDEQYLKSAAVHNDTSYIRHCDANHEYCLIEQFIQNGKVSSLIRDCNNKKDFSVEENQKGRLKNVNTKNETVCTFTGGYLVCISLCDQDYCNGPTGSNPNSAALYSLSFKICL